MKLKVWKEAWRRNQEEGIGTSIPGRSFMVAAFSALLWGIVFDKNADWFDYVVAATASGGFLALLIFGLTEDYQEAKEALDDVQG